MCGYDFSQRAFVPAIPSEIFLNAYNASSSYNEEGLLLEAPLLFDTAEAADFAALGPFPLGALDSPSLPYPAYPLASDSYDSTQWDLDSWPGFQTLEAMNTATPSFSSPAAPRPANYQPSDPSPVLPPPKLETETVAAPAAPAWPLATTSNQAYPDSISLPRSPSTSPEPPKSPIAPHGPAPKATPQKLSDRPLALVGGVGASAVRVKRLHSRVAWTGALHNAFLASIESLGGIGKATPKVILQHMAVKGLRIKHVKSHLQKHRKDVADAQDVSDVALSE